MDTVRWRLKKGHDRRLKSGHPWVYSNELQESPRGIVPGQVVELSDAGGEFLAHGFGNPSSLIAFRSVSRSRDEADAMSGSGIERRLIAASSHRRRLGLGHASYRLCFAEADLLPGLIIDRYLLGSQAQVLVVQAHTAGMDRVIPEILPILEAVVAVEWGKESWTRTSVVLRNDIGIRKLEGLSEEPPRVLKLGDGTTESALKESTILVRSAWGEGVVPFRCDLLEGQKTGFFLDQSANVELAIRRLIPLASAQRTWNVLDLCSYVGQWSTQIGRALKSQGANVRVTAVDASERALAFAAQNLQSSGIDAQTVRGDVLHDLTDWKDGEFDWVICDPPALIKGRKDIGPGSHAYLQLNTLALRLVRPGGALVSCSCSALFGEQEFTGALAKAARRTGRTVRWIARGTQGPDHPELAEFPEGRYLKAFMGVTDGNQQKKN